MRDSISIPKNILTKLIIAQAANTMTKPISAAVIWLRADSVEALSPPEVIYLIPPKINMKRKAKAAITKIITIAEEMSVSILINPRFPKLPPGDKFNWAK